MRVCRHTSRGQPCNALNRDEAGFCISCGHVLDLALTVHNPGTVIGHWYRILNLIGYGGFGAVYEAEVVKHTWAPHVALKETLRPEHVGEFHKEFSVLRKLEHTNLPRYLHVFEAGGRGYLVMEYVPGQSLFDIIQRKRGPVHERLVISYGVQICDVLEYLHGQDPPILHRDIKPQNIRLTPEGLIKLVDFGLVKSGAESTEQIIVRGGSPIYAPLEQWLGGTDERSDVYSLGATLYHLLTGQFPEPPARRHGAAADTLIHPRELNSRVSPLIADVVLDAMHLDRRKRFQSAAALRSALLAAAQAVTQPFESAPITLPVTMPVSIELFNEVAGAIRESRATLSAPRLARPMALAVGETPPEFIQHQRLTGHEAPVQNIAWGTHTSILASGDSAGRMILWGDAPLRQHRSIVAGPAEILGLAWSPDDRMLASAGREKTIRLWRPSTGAQYDWWEAHTGAIYALAWRPDGAILASAGWDQTVRLWHIARGELLVVGVGHQHHVRSLAWSPDSTTLASGSLDGYLRLWDGEGQAVGAFKSQQGAALGLAWSPAGDLLASAGTDGSVRLWTRGGTLEQVLNHGQSEANCVQWSPNQNYLACGTADGNVHLWRLADGTRTASFRAHSARVNAIAWHPHGEWLATAGDDHTVLLWRVGASEGYDAQEATV